MVTSGALHTVRANLNWLAGEKKAHYIAVVKKNQPLLHARIKALPRRQIPAGWAAAWTTTSDTPVHAMASVKKQRRSGKAAGVGGGMAGNDPRGGAVAARAGRRRGWP